ncbi:MAG: hypothetical protein RI909_1111, partial [Bacteroidota bacterium]
MRFKDLLIILLFFGSSNVFAQASVRIIPSSVMGVRYAELSTDGKYLVVSQVYDTIRIMDAKTLHTTRIVPMVNSGNGMRVWHQTGKKEFYITAKNELIYVSRVIRNDSASLFLQSQNLETGKINFSKFLLRYHVSEYFASSLKDIHISYGLSSASNRLLLSMQGNVYEFDEEDGKLLRRWQVPNVEEAALSLKNNWLALACGDSLKILNTKNA